MVWQLGYVASAGLLLYCREAKRGPTCPSYNSMTMRATWTWAMFGSAQTVCVLLANFNGSMPAPTQSLVGYLANAQAGVKRSEFNAEWPRRQLAGSGFEQLFYRSVGPVRVKSGRLPKLALIRKSPPPGFFPKRRSRLRKPAADPDRPDR